MFQDSFYRLLSEFIKSTGLEMEVPSAEDLESFEFFHDGTRCIVHPAGDATHVVVEAGALRLDSLPLLERSRAVRYLHGLNRAALATNHLVATLDVDDEIRVCKSLPIHGLTAAALADEMVSAVEAARSLAQSLRLLPQAGHSRPGNTPEVPPEPSASTIPCPLQLA